MRTQFGDMRSDDYEASPRRDTLSSMLDRSPCCGNFVPSSARVLKRLWRARSAGREGLTKARHTLDFRRCFN